jgi:hypothetical protein
MHDSKFADALSQATDGETAQDRDIRVAGLTVFTTGELPREELTEPPPPAQPGLPCGAWLVSAVVGELRAETLKVEAGLYLWMAAVGARLASR